MVPDAYVRLDALPLTGNGKTARSLLPEPTRDTIIRTDEAPSPATPATAGSAPADGTTLSGLTRTVATAFAATLGTDDFATDANFFDLGGDSANVTLAAARLSESLGTPVSTTSIFATGTPAALARLLAAEGTVKISEPETEPEPETARAQPVAVPTATGAAREPDRPAPASAQVTGRTRNSARPPAGDALAVIGMACRFPGAATPDEFWQNLLDGVSSIDEAPADRRGWAHLWSESDEARMGWLDGVERFDAARFGLTDREARRTDPSSGSCSASRPRPWRAAATITTRSGPAPVSSSAPSPATSRSWWPAAPATPTRTPPPVPPCPWSPTGCPTSSTGRARASPSTRPAPPPWSPCTRRPSTCARETWTRRWWAPPT